ncbi:MAG: hypothetical protein U0237_02660 [Thermoleophilia bacterium]
MEDAVHRKPGRALSLIGVAVGALITVGMILWVPAETGLATIIAGLVVGFVVTLAAHEAGHAIAASALGMPPMVIGIGPVHLQRGRRARLRRPFAPGFVMVLPDPEVPLPEIARRFRRVGLAGPPVGILASAALGVGAGAATGSARGLLVCAALAGVINLPSLVPVSGRTVLSDAARVRRLRWGAPTARTDAACLAILGAAFTRPPAEWPRHLLEEELVLSRDAVMDAMTLSVRAMVAEIAGDLDDAEASLDQALTLPLHPAQLGAYRAGRAYLRARAGRAEEAREDLDAVPSRTPWLRPVVRERVTAAVLLSEGRHADARAALARARAVLDDPMAPIPCEEAGIRELEGLLAAAGH